MHDVNVRGREPERLRHHADDFERFAAEIGALADHGPRGAELSLPEHPRAEHDEPIVRAAHHLVVAQGLGPASD